MIKSVTVNRALQFIGVLLLGVTLGYCADKDYQQGTLNDLQLVQAATGFGRAGQNYCLSVSSDGISYLVQYYLMWANSHSPSDLMVGDSVQVRVKGNTMYVRKPKGGDYKTEITRRERISEGKPPLSCSVPVTPR